MRVRLTEATRLRMVGQKMPVTKGALREFLRGDLSKRDGILFRVTETSSRPDLVNTILGIKQITNNGCHTLFVTLNDEHMAKVVTHRHPSGVIMAVVS